jgi:metal-responsive CopG/Arc/MetJ family transcriptional regulator
MENVKFSAPLTTVFELDDRAKKTGRSRSEIVRHLVDRGLGMTPESRNVRRSCR